MQTALAPVLLTAIDPWRGQVLPSIALTRDHLTTFLRTAAPNLHEIALGQRNFLEPGRVQAQRMLDLAVSEGNLGVVERERDDQALALALLQVNQRLNPDVDEGDLVAASRELTRLLAAPDSDLPFARVMTLLHRYGPRLQRLTEQGRLAELLKRPDWREVFAEPLLEMIRNMEGISLFAVREGSAAVFSEKLSEEDPSGALLELVRLIHEIYVVIEQRQANASASIVNAPTLLAIASGGGLSTTRFALFTDILGGRGAVSATDVFPNIPPPPSEPAIDKETLICRIVYGQDSSPDSQTGTQVRQIDFLREALDDDGFLRVQGNVAGGGEAIPKWKVKKVLGEGGMAVALLAEDTELGNVVIKIAHKVPEGMKEEYYARFQNERRIQGKVRGSSHILTVYDYGHTLFGYPFVALEYAGGGDLAGLINDEVSIPLHDKIRLLIGLSAGVADTHSKDLTHRDIKPDNFLISQEANGHGQAFDPAKVRVVLADFGIAIEGTSHDEDVIIGTGGYAAPEIMPLDGKTHPQYSRRTDVFALAATAYTFLTGSNPLFDLMNRLPELWTTIEGDPEIDPVAKFLLRGLNQKGDEANFQQIFCLGYLVKYVRTPHELNPEIPEHLSQLIMKGLAFNPDDRFADAEEFRQALLDYQKWTEANIHWQEAIAQLAHAEGARSARNMTTWADAARAAFYEAVKAIRIYRDPEWVQQIITVLYQTFKYAESIGDEQLRHQILQDMALIHSLIPAGEVTNHPMVEQAIRRAHRKGEIVFKVSGVPPEANPTLTFAGLAEIDGVLQVPTQGGKTVTIDKFVLDSDGNLTIDGTIPRGSYLVRFEAKGYAPVSEVIFMPRRGKFEHTFRPVPLADVPKGFAHIGGGRYYKDPGAHQGYNRIPQDPSQWVQVPDFLIDKEPVSNRRYFEALVKLALRDGIDAAMHQQLMYLGRPMWKNTNDFIRRVLNRFTSQQRVTTVTIDDVLDEFFGKADFLKQFVDMEDEAILWNGPASFTSLQNAAAIIPILVPGGRLPTYDEMARVAVGSDLRPFPWGNSPPEIGDGNFNIRNDVIPNITPIGSPRFKGRRGFIDVSPLGEVINVMTSRVWTGTEINARRVTFGWGWSLWPAPNALVVAYGPASGSGSGSIEIRIAKDLVAPYS